MRDEVGIYRYLTISHEGMAKPLTGAHHCAPFPILWIARWDRCANFQ